MWHGESENEILFAGQPTRSSLLPLLLDVGQVLSSSAHFLLEIDHFLVLLELRLSRDELRYKQEPVPRSSP